ncbi:MAG: septation regulator SpoVG [Clostridia bacterium]|nr:septation regulator SpoVG [Clostridia bacterium]
MQITDIKIRKAFEEGPMKAVVSVTFDNQFAVHDIKVIYANEKHFIVMPSRKNADGTYRDIAHPINAEFRALMEKEVLARYFEQADTLLSEESQDAE